MLVLDFLFQFHLPCSRERNRPAQPTRSEVRRWCEQQAVLINGRRAHWRDTVDFPLWQVIFFPASPTSRVTFIDRTL
jgi:hypothetical protein